MRPGQKVPCGGHDRQAHYVVGEGLITLQAEWPGGLRCVLAILGPGDATTAGAFPPGSMSSLVAAAPSEILVVGAKVVAELALTNASLRDSLFHQVSDQLARATLHAAMLSALTAEERLATLLVDLALRQGEASSGLVSVEIALSRAEMASYLALNADTLSRVMSHLKSRGFVHQASRSRIVIRDWEGLNALSPMAGTLAALARRSHPPARPDPGAGGLVDGGSPLRSR